MPKHLRPALLEGAIPNSKTVSARISEKGQRLNEIPEPPLEVHVLFRQLHNVSALRLFVVCQQPYFKIVPMIYEHCNFAGVSSFGLRYPGWVGQKKLRITTLKKELREAFFKAHAVL